MAGFSVLFPGVVFAAPKAPAKDDPCACLPKDFDCGDVVSAGRSRPGAATGQAGKVTIKQSLEQIKARCAKGKLVDAPGRPVFFYRLAGCWGNPPQDYQEILRRQEAELAALKKRYRVIELTCNPSGEQLSLIMTR